MLRKTNKKASHVGFVLSFVLFIGFLLFVFLILQPPIREGQDKTRYLDTLRLNLFQNISAEGGEVMIIYNTSEITSQQTCVVLNIIGDGEEQISANVIANNQLLIKNLSNNEFNYTRIGGSNNLRIGGWPAGYLKNNGYFLKVYLLENTNPNNDPSNQGTTTGCSPTSASDYGLSFIMEEGSDYPGEEQIENLTDAVSTEELYASIKLALDIPPGSDFAFNFTFSDGTTIGTDWNVPSGTGLFIREYSVLYIDRDDDLQLGKLIIGIW
jgi:hypothetical protein